MDARQQRGLEIAAITKITQKDGEWTVPSQSGMGRYKVDPDKSHCNCPDHETRGIKCKHIYAVEYVIQREFNFDDGTVTQTETVPIQKTVKRTYSQNWTAYNAAQTNEKGKFQELLSIYAAGSKNRSKPRRGAIAYL
jgi:hypothetical protein